MLPAPTLSTCSLVLESHGPWLPSSAWKLSAQSSSFWQEDTQPSEESLEDPSSSRLSHLPSSSSSGASTS